MTPTPTFLVVGAPRAGTTSLHHWLGQHPDVCASRPKETQFFSLHHRQGTRYYEPFFRHHAGEPVLGESTPMYLSLPYVPRRIAETLPDVDLIAVLREPVQQAYSSWWKLRCLGAERRSFEDAIAGELDEDPLDDVGAERYWRRLLEASERGQPIDTGRYLMTGRYVEAISRYHEHLRPEQLTVVLFDDLVRDPTSVTRRIAGAIGIDLERAVSPVPPRVNRSRGRTEAWVRRRVRGVPSARVREGLARVARRFDRAGRPPLSETTRRELTAYFAEANRGLGELIGADVSSWFGSSVTRP